MRLDHPTLEAAGAMPDAMPRAVETPSGKDSGNENFPVGSWLLPARLRPHVATFYAFARAIDDIADNPALEPEDKVVRLDGFATAILGHDTDHPGYAKAHRMRESLAETGVPPQHCLDLIAAFKQDATKTRYRDWVDLMGYCTLSASPVGRYPPRPAWRIPGRVPCIGRAVQRASGHQPPPGLPGRLSQPRPRLPASGLDGGGGCDGRRPRR